MDEALALARRIAANPGGVLRMTKRLLREGERSSLESLLELSAGYQAIAHMTDDHHEAVRAFVCASLRAVRSGTPFDIRSPIDVQSRVTGATRTSSSRARSSDDSSIMCCSTRTQRSAAAPTVRCWRSSDKDSPAPRAFPKSTKSAANSSRSTDEAGPDVTVLGRQPGMDFVARAASVDREGFAAGGARLLGVLAGAQGCACSDPARQEADPRDQCRGERAHSDD